MSVGAHSPRSAGDLSSSAKVFTRVKAAAPPGRNSRAAPGAEYDYDSASRRAIERASTREWAPSFRYTDEVMVLTVLCET